MAQETRFFEASSGRTVHMRSKESETDYRYVPEPDLPPLRLSESDVSALRATLPELPERTRTRLMEQYHLSPYDAGTLVAEDGAASYFEASVAGRRSPKKVANWLTTELFGHLHRHALPLSASPVQPARLGALLDLLESNRINGPVAKKVLARMMEGDARDPDELVRAEGLESIVEEAQVEQLARHVLAAEAARVAEYHAGKHTLLKFFVGQVMAKTQGRAPPELVTQIITRLLTAG